jgi:hypothetical protein
MPNATLISPDQLRALTEGAIARATAATTDKVRKIVRDGAEHIKVEVLAGRKHATIMSLRKGTDFDNFGVGKTISAAQLTGLAALVWARVAGLKATLEYWSHNASSMYNETWLEEGANIVVHWKSLEEACDLIRGLGDSELATSLNQLVMAAQAEVSHKAQAILLQLNDRAALAAGAGKNFATVMSIKENVDFTSPSPCAERKDVCKPEWLGAVARAVWDACETYKPTLEYWAKTQSDWRGEDTWEESGFNIVVHW